MEHHILRACTGSSRSPKDLYVLVAAETRERACQLAAGVNGRVPRSRVDYVASGGMPVEGPERILQKCSTCMEFSF